MTLLQATIGVGLGLIGNEAYGLSPWLARQLVWHVAWRLYPADRAAVRAEEWLALIDDRPGKLLKLGTALGLAARACAHLLAAGARRRCTVASRLGRLVRVKITAASRSKTPDVTAMAGTAMLSLGKSDFSPLIVVLSYEVSEPYALTASFHSDGDKWVTWTFARELLLHGADTNAGHVGEGDVWVWPLEAPGRRYVAVLLDSSEGRAICVLRRRLLVRFLARIYHLVPDGLEPELDIDSIVTRLLET